ncbi:MAG: radical SAM protein, partial [bacterium]
MIHPRLRLVFWELTRGCNLRCVHCRAAAELQRSPDELVLEECRTVVDSIASAGSPILVLTGGEPLYRPDVYDIAAHAASRGLRVAVASNGTLMTDDA